MKVVFLTVLCWLALPVLANGDGSADLSVMAGADVIILGEVHDNPHHHKVQARLVAELQPTALVFEMLNVDQAALLTNQNRSDKATLEAVLDWDQTGWPDFALYFPIFEAGESARIYGAGLARGVAGEALKAGVAQYFGTDAAVYGLDHPLPEAEQSDREAYQHAAHCEALPETMLPMMVDLQRLRDALLARAAVTALEQEGGPVVVVTGNGHARLDRGMAGYLIRARPDTAIYVLGQSEDGQIEGDFDRVQNSPAVERPDPCLEFEKQE